MRRKKERGLTLRFWLTLTIVVEIGIIIAISWGLTTLLRYFDITLHLPELVWLIVIGLVLAGAITVVITHWIFRPIVRLEEAMEEVANGNFDVRLDAAGFFPEIRRLYENFNRMTQELQATEILQTDFVSNVSHEIKTPVNAIEGYAMLLQGSEGADDENGRYVEKILFNTRRLSTLVGNILLLSKVDNQGIPGKETTFRLDEQIRQSILSLESRWLEKEVEFDVDLERIEYTGNEALLIHIWNNLIENAIKFGPRGGNIRLRLFRQEESVCFSVSDEGPGIPEEDQKHIFDRFYQSDSSHKSEGNGLGLALVSRILKTVGGVIRMENLPEGGCRFTVILK